MPTPRGQWNIIVNPQQDLKRKKTKKLIDMVLN